MLSHSGRHGFESGHIRGRPGSISATFCWRVDGNENDIGLAHALGHISRENQIRLSSSNVNQALAVPFALAGAIGRRGGRLGSGIWLIALSRSVLKDTFPRTVPGNAQDVVQARLVDRGMLGVPPADAVRVSIDDSDLNMGVVKGDHGGSWPAYTRDVNVSNGQHGWVICQQGSLPTKPAPTQQILRTARGV